MSIDIPPHMLIRPLRPVDLLAFAAFQGHAGETEITAHTWPRVDPECGEGPFLHLTSAVLAQRVAGERVWVAPADHGLGGLAIVRARRGGLAWDVDHLHTRQGHERAAVALLDHVCDQAGKALVRRVFLEAPSEAHSQELARRATLERYAGSTLFMLGRERGHIGGESVTLRPRTFRDDFPLHQLYNASVPAGVRSAEALSLEEWVGLRRGRPAATSFVRPRRQYVWEQGNRIVGWAEVTRGQRSQYAELLIHPDYTEASDRLLRSLLATAGHKGSLYVAARDYQPWLATTLQQGGFRPVANHDLYVKLLTVPVREARLVPLAVPTT